ncbi:MAG TPA: excinuclease ABC subunit A, partial [Opitutae bacterium]|nr:excinuclease ABC subunit A [Opitutae bacterium]
MVAKKKGNSGFDEGCIFIKRARENNLKNLTVEIPRGKLIGVTGVSGSGKSSLVFDIMAAEGHRKYVESLSTQARQALEKVRRPDVDFVEGLSPVLAIGQAFAGSSGPRSTVASATEIADYARLLWATIGIPHCPLDGSKVSQRSLDDCVNEVMQVGEGNRLILLAPFMTAKVSVLREEFESLERRGYQRVRIDGEIKRLDDYDLLPEKSAGREFTVEIVIDRFVIKESNRSRLADSLELAFKEGEERAITWIDSGEQKKEINLSQSLACESCGTVYPKLTPRHFSWNHPSGACSTCDGIGDVLSFREDLVIPDPSLTLGKGAIKPWRLGSRKMINLRKNILKALAEQVPFDNRKSWENFPEEVKELLLFGDPQKEFVLKLQAGRGKAKKQVFPGILKDLENTMRTTSSETLRAKLLAYQQGKTCPECKGKRLSSFARSVLVNNLSLGDFLNFSAREAWDFLKPNAKNQKLFSKVSDAYNGLEQRLGFINEVGLGYLSLDRESGTLSGGEAQRIRLATQIGGGLVGVLYILDEPSIGLHQRDNDRLLETLIRLRDLGNSVLVVEHDEDTIRRADYVVDMGPGAGINGGDVVAYGTVDDILGSERSFTGKYLSGVFSIDVPSNRIIPTPDKGYLTIKGATENNLKNIDVRIPLGLLTCVTGVSGSGKSTLIDGILRKTLMRKWYGAKDRPGKHQAIYGDEKFSKIIVMNQSPIGRTPRSNPATYTGIFNQIRDLFARLPSSRIRGYESSRFSFNVKGGRCEKCQGDGLIKIEMHF